MTLTRAQKLYKTFHQFKPRRIGEFAQGFHIPDEVVRVGTAKVMYYTSDKLNPETGEDEGLIKYFHDHKKSVDLYLPDEIFPGEWCKVPHWIRNAQALTKLGTCDGYDFIDLDGKQHRAEATGRKPEWYTLPSGKALFVIQDKRKVLAMAWGGELRVEWRGVVG
jgi:hypothetical protein